MIKQTQSAIVLENLIDQLIFSKTADAGSGSKPALGASVDPAPAAASNSGALR